MCPDVHEQLVPGLAERDVTFRSEWQRDRHAEAAPRHGLQDLCTAFEVDPCWVTLAVQRDCQLAERIQTDDFMVEQRRSENGHGAEAFLDAAHVPGLRVLPGGEVRI